MEPKINFGDLTPYLTYAEKSKKFENLMEIKNLV
jgi:hypothetical protein